MRKHKLISMLILAASCLLLLGFTIFYNNKQDYNKCTAKKECTPEMENIKGTDMLWESFSRQFISSVCTQ